MWIWLKHSLRKVNYLWEDRVTLFLEMHSGRMRDKGCKFENEKLGLGRNNYYWFIYFARRMVKQCNRYPSNGQFHKSGCIFLLGRQEKEQLLSCNLAIHLLLLRHRVFHCWVICAVFLAEYMQNTFLMKTSCPWVFHCCCVLGYKDRPYFFQPSSSLSSGMHLHINSFHLIQTSIIILLQTSTSVVQGMCVLLGRKEKQRKIQTLERSNFEFCMFLWYVEMEFYTLWTWIVSIFAE